MFVLVAGAAAFAALAWWFWWRSDERAIRRELARLVEDVNAPATEGLGAVSWAAQLGTHFTDNAVVDFGGGSTPIEGRRAIVGLATRFVPTIRTGTVAIDDIVVTEGTQRGTATVDVRVTFTPSQERPGDGVDAREFTLQMERDGGRWRIARAVAVDATQSAYRRSPDSGKSGLEK